VNAAWRENPWGNFETVSAKKRVTLGHRTY
jgi:hypothetical protein